ncbi:MAG: metalloprotease PmbA, partial [Burkholderiales bacterium]
LAYSSERLQGIAADVLREARTAGASACEMSVSESYGQVVSVRKAEVESIEYNRDKNVGVGVYLGQQFGFASTSDFSPQALRETVDAAVAIARFTASDDANGLAEPELVATHLGDLDLFHPWDLSSDDAIEIAKEAEAAAFALDRRITNSDGASVSCQHSQFISAHSNGFMGGYSSSRHYIACSAIAQEGDDMQRDDWYSTARAHRDLAKPQAIGTYAGKRTLARLRGRQIKTMNAPVLFEAPVALGLISHFVSAVSGTSLYRKSSFLVDSVGTQVFAPHVTLREDPHVKGGMASSYFDDDGVATSARDVVKDGVVQGYFLGVYSARKLGLKTTGNSGGSHNLTLSHGKENFQQMVRKLGRGLLVTELMGQGVNLVTGDYSRGAAGYWVEGGEIQYPVEEITIAGNLRDIFKNIVAVGSDTINRGGRVSGSILVESMTIAGK